MRLWPFKRKDPEPTPEPEDEQITIIVTPYAGMVHELQSLGLWGNALVKAIQIVEAKVAEAERRVRAEMNLAAHRVAEKPRVTAPRNQPQRSPVTTKPKRKRAGYMQQYRANRAKLSVVTRNHEDAA